MSFADRQNDPFGVICLETVSAERAAVILIRYEIRSAGRAVLFGEEFPVRFSFFGVSRSLQSERPLDFFREWFFAFGEICLAFVGVDSNRGCILRVDDFFQNDRPYAVVKQLIAAGVLVSYDCDTSIFCFSVSR